MICTRVWFARNVYFYSVKFPFGEMVMYSVISTQTVFFAMSFCTILQNKNMTPLLKNPIAKINKTSSSYTNLNFFINDS
jgi:hypothetical protein